MFLCASAIGIYGDREDETLTEDSILGDGFLADVCSDWETEARKLETEGVRSAQIRTALVLGDEKGALEKMLPAVRMGLLGKIGSGQQWMSWIHIQDWVRAAIFLLKEDGAKGPFDFSSPQPVRNEEFTDTLNAIFSRRSFIATPKLAIRFAMGEMSHVLLDSQKVLPKKLQDLGFSFQFVSLKDALQNLFPDGLKKSKLERQVWVKRPVEEVFPFFADPANLEKITPPLLKFKILSSSTAQVEKGSEIRYQLKVHGIPMNWVTDIEEFQKNKYFIDNQRKGPYKTWHHTHSFIGLRGGTLMTDTVRYKVPFGWFGEVVSFLMVNKDVRKIFSFRNQILKDMYK